MVIIYFMKLNVAVDKNVIIFSTFPSVSIDASTKYCGLPVCNG